MEQTQVRSKMSACGRMSAAWCWIAVLVLMLPGRIAAQGGMQFDNTTWVPATSDGVANCQRLRDTLDSLPSSPDQLVHLAPGLYFCDSATLFVRTQVTLLGSGDRTVIVGVVDSSILGVVHLRGRSVLRRLQVWNLTTTPTDGSIAVSAWELVPSGGSPTLVDVKTLLASSAGTVHPLFVIDEDVVVEGGSFPNGDIRLSGSNYTFKLSGSALEGIDADPTVVARCHYYRNLDTGAPNANPFGVCP